MRLLLATAANAARWQQAFRDALPRATLHVWPEAPPEVDYALVWKPPAGCFEHVRIARGIVNLGAGVDALLAVPTLPPGVPILRLVDAGMAEQMAEYVTLAVLGAYREQRAYAEQQREARWVQRPRLDKPAFRVGLLGLGVLGRAVVDALRPFGFPLAAWTRHAHEVPDVAVHVGDAGLRAMLAQTAVLVCMLPSTPATRGLLDASTMRALPRGAHVVNVARGDLVVERDLLALLDDGHLASATLDVFIEEPLPPAHPFWHHPKVVLTPHVSAATLVDASVAQVAARLHAHFRGEPVDGLVERARGY